MTRPRQTAVWLLLAAVSACSEDDPPAEEVEVVVAQELTSRWAILSHRISALELTYDPRTSAVAAQNDGGGFGAVDTPEAVYGWTAIRSRELVAAFGSVTIAIPPGSEADGEPFSAVGQVELEREPLREATALVAYLRGYRIDADAYESPPDFETDPDLPYDPVEGYTSQGIGIALGAPAVSDETVGVEVRVRNSLGTSDRADMNAAIPRATTWVRVDVVVVGATGPGGAASRGAVDYFLGVPGWGRGTVQPRAAEELQGFEVSGEPGPAAALLGLTAFDVWVNVDGHHDPDCVVDQDDINSWDEPVSGPGRYLREIGLRIHDSTYDAEAGAARGKLDLYVSTASEYDEIGNLCAGLRGEVGMLQLDDPDAATESGSLSLTFASGEAATEPLVVGAP
ncbi:MAG: hypothetical protein HYY06_18260 [Deltaproteobacteria bacterium]|nr:hypothetical protein [Deltaproteobacteria bacterium]